tara:strand:- start:63 stop:524 length:462 start_codon:yes stop_codon:yes gene_type:complete
MANTLESLKATSKIIVHNSATDLTDKSPLQYYQGATISELVTTARIPQDTPPALTGGSINFSVIAKGVVIADASSGNITLTTQAAGQADDHLGFVNFNDSFDFSIINTHASNTATLATGNNVTIVGNDVVAGNTSALFRIRKTGAGISIYRLA